MKKILFALIFLSHSAISQTIYQPHEVETPAEPTGGADMLNLFLSSISEYLLNHLGKG